MSEHEPRGRKPVIRQSVLTPAMQAVLAPPAAPRTWSARIAELDPRRFFLQTWRQLDAEAEAERAARIAAGKPGWDWRPLVALATGALFLTLMEYAGHEPHFVRFLEWTAIRDGSGAPLNLWAEIADDHAWRELWGFAWWSLWRVLGYFVFPIVVIKLVFRERVRDHGLETKGFLDHAWIYGLAYLVVFACVLLVTRYDPHFREYYPFYDRSDRSWADLAMWEVLYAAQFFSLEFFFRGFWLTSLKRTLGSQAIFAMVVPYCMIHFGKPFLECLAAILAGIFLGTLAMKTRSIWSGFLIHVSVAITMDLSALIATDRLPTTWLPP